MIFKAVLLFMTVQKDRDIWFGKMIGSVILFCDKSRFLEANYISVYMTIERLI